MSTFSKAYEFVDFNWGSKKKEIARERYNCNCKELGTFLKNGGKKFLPFLSFSFKKFWIFIFFSFIPWIINIPFNTPFNLWNSNFLFYFNPSRNKNWNKKYKQ